MFEEFAKKLAEELKRDLPGFSAQKSMAPLGRRPPLEYLKEGIVPKKSAVLILLYPKPASVISTVLILRPENEGGTHAGQISFPGGSFHDTDRDMSETALRETEEEIGVDRNTVSVIGELSPLYIPVSNFMVQPFVGISPVAPTFNIHPLEVQEVIEVNVADLLLESNCSSVERFVKLKNEKLQVPCYEVSGKTIWGATAMILAEFAEIVKRIK